MSPDQVLLRYLELRERLGSPPGQDPVMMQGLWHARRCENCGHGDHIEVRNRHAHYIVRCARCLRPWTVRPANVLRGTIQVPRAPQGPERLLSETATLALRLGRCTVWELRCWYLYLTRPGGQRRTAEHAREAWPSAPFPWTHYRVRELVRSARLKVAD